MSKSITINCPSCKKLLEWNKKNLFRPFCSRNCQLVDLVDWVSEKKYIPFYDKF